jgi:RimJ/RimL family protein N-acetyltransferase
VSTAEGGQIMQKSGELIGGMNLSPTEDNPHNGRFGIWINPKYHRCGYGSEALNAIIKWGFDVKKYEEIYAGHFVGNTASHNLQLKCGLTPTGEIKKGAYTLVWDNNSKHDEVIMKITKEEYIKGAGVGV